MGVSAGTCVGRGDRDARGGDEAAADLGNGCSEGVTETSLFGSEKKRTIPIKVEA